MQHHERKILREMLIGTCLSAPIIGTGTLGEYLLAGTVEFLYFGVLLMAALWVFALVCLCVITLLQSVSELLEADPP